MLLIDNRIVDSLVEELGPVAGSLEELVLVEELSPVEGSLVGLVHVEELDPVEDSLVGLVLVEELDPVVRSLVGLDHVEELSPVVDSLKEGLVLVEELGPVAGSLEEVLDPKVAHRTITVAKVVRHIEAIDLGQVLHIAAAIADIPVEPSLGQAHHIIIVKEQRHIAATEVQHHITAAEVQHRIAAVVQLHRTVAVDNPFEVIASYRVVMRSPSEAASYQAARTSIVASCQVGHIPSEAASYRVVMRSPSGNP